jgi:hypothetical protein
MRTLVLITLAALLAACGGGSSAVTDQGHALSPKSSLISSSTGDHPVTTLAISDAAGLCDTLTALDPCTASKAAPDGTILVFGVESVGSTPPSPNTIQAGQTIAIDAKQGWTASGGFEVVTGGQVIFTDDLASGTVTFSAFSPNGPASGSYDVLTQGGAHLQGSFSADFCQGLFAATNTSTSCSEGGNGASCTASCTCNSEKVSAACSVQIDGSWTCTCTNKSGATSTCTVPSAGGTQACEQQSGCCPLSF